VARSEQLALPAYENSAAWFDAIGNHDWENRTATLPVLWQSRLGAAQIAAWQEGSGGLTQVHRFAVRRIVLPKYRVTVNSNHPTEQAFVSFNNTPNAFTAAANSGAASTPEILGGRLITINRGTCVARRGGVALPPAGKRDRHRPMKHFSTSSCLFAVVVISSSARAQAVSSAAFGSTVAVWSGHTTVRERVDAGVNERIELWNRTWIVSPSGQVYSNTDHWGFDAPDGYAATTITFNETGRWSYWASDGGSIDNFVYGDSASDWYIWPHNSPNGVGYGGWGRRLTTYIDIGAANNAPTITWTATPGNVGSGQNYSVTAHGHDADGNLTQVNIWKNGVGFAFAGGGNGTDGDSGNTTSDSGPATITFTANAVDSNGATSATISQTVTITAANSAPTIAWTATPGSVASGQSYSGKCSRTRCRRQPYPGEYLEGRRRLRVLAWRRQRHRWRLRQFNVGTADPPPSPSPPTPSTPTV
jgi:hypothetical protein